MSQSKHEVMQASETIVKRFVNRFDASNNPFDSPYYFLACHVALPLVITPDLVNYIRVYFLKEEGVPWIAEADLLLSNLCRPVGYEQYVMDKGVKAYLLKKLRQDSRFGGEVRLKEIASLLFSYIQHLDKTNPFISSKEIQTQKWGAMLYLETDQTVQDIAKAISECVDELELIRLLKITKDFQQEITALGKFDDFLEYAQLSNDLLRKPETVKPEQIKSAYPVAGLELTLPPTVTEPPYPLDLESFESQVTIATIVFEESGGNYAIAIGVNQYQYLPPLKYAVGSAKVMKHWFDEQNFNSLEPSPVDFRLDPISATVEEFLQRKFQQPFLSAEDTVWFFFSGHSRFKDGVDYLMLADSIPERVVETGVSLNFVVQQLLRSGAGKVILFLDMDRLAAPGSSPLSSSFVAEDKKDDQGVIIFYACESNTAAYEPNQLQQRSFTYALVEALLATQGNLSINQLTKFLSDRVPELNEQNIQPAHTPQTPQSLIIPDSIGEWVPFPSNFQVFDCQTPTVNRRGETIHKDTKLIRYFTEPLTDNVTLEMVAIPGGTFTMGTDEAEIERLVKKFGWDGYRREKPQHNVTLSPFFMGKYPITQAQWKAIASQTNLKVNIDLDEEPSNFKGDNRPVEQVNWYEAVEFCQRLSKLTGRDYRLPSEAQWEYACRSQKFEVPRSAPTLANRSQKEELTIEEWNDKYCQPFYFGETITGELANYDASNTYADEPKGEYREETTPVGQFPANAFGLYDLHGNVWEWCLDDWHHNYEDAPDDGSAWMEFEPSYLAKNKQNDSNSVMRGGSWLDYPNDCRSAIRSLFISRGNRDLYIGFRVVYVFGKTE